MMMNWWWWYFWSIEAKVKYIENTRYWSWSIWILKSQPKNLDTLVKKTQIRRWVGAGADHAPFTTFRTLQKSQFSAISSSKLHPISLASIKPTMATSSSSTTTISQLSCFSSLNSRRHHLHRRSILSLPQSPRYKVLKKPNLFFLLYSDTTMQETNRFLWLQSWVVMSIEGHNNEAQTSTSNIKTSSTNHNYTAPEEYKGISDQVKGVYGSAKIHDFCFGIPFGECSFLFPFGFGKVWIFSVCFVFGKIMMQVLANVCFFFFVLFFRWGCFKWGASWFCLL